MMGMNALTIEAELYRSTTSEPLDSAEFRTENVRRVQRTMVVRLIEDSGGSAVHAELEQFAVINIIEDLMGRAGTVFLIDKSTIGLVLYGTKNELTDEAMERLQKFLGSCLAKYAKVQARIGIGEMMHTFLDLNKALAAALAAVEAAPPSEEQSTHPFVEEAKAILQQNYGDGVCLKSIAKQLFVNPAYLGRLFKSYEAISFNDYLVQVRMEKAKELLIGTDKRIYEIAHEVGYRQLDWFYKKFKEYTGCSAKEFKSINM
ncbi:helix-turn-helix transcriptional regulator [Cohnella thailandensis]|jgi:Response regulator containing CheY-like receiver domain and AraC-type DNA-binding domain|uniref:Helix-turn-helix domain-containing protein n=1 Tax=Cohnella thailandensis TaxID=557557 RepID=A0A841T496_9BACL|nr:helix-turn-helix domain-containing protein [Cohnella thailandensis]MBB6637819.1 helix-turn-helix domain-containing protein [Cohnella thailandensis]MBP1974001.1 AraC-like DNA-binding protein [Cohnella thailandensis]